MRVVMAKNAGFCFGVKRALQFAEEAVESYGMVCSLGPLIHNPQEVERLKQKGIVAVDDLNLVTGSRAIIRSHGVSPEIFSQAEKLNISLIDATCPFVKRAQLYAKDLAENGYRVVVVGDRNHPEVEGIVGWSNQKACVVENAEEAGKILLGDKVGVIAQTTQQVHNFQQVAEVLKNKNPHLVIHNTICLATAERQKATEKLAQEVDLVLVVGGLNSANTQKLARIARETGTPAFLVEKAQDIDFEWLKGKDQVGITAGASTPDWIIKEVLQRMMEFTDQEEQRTEENATENLEETVKESNEEVTEENVSVQTEEETPAPEAPSGDASFADSFDTGIKQVRRGERVSGVIVQVRDSEVLVDVGGKSEGVIPRSELTAFEAENIHEALKVGDQIEVVVLKKENDEGHPVLSKRRVDQEKNWEKLIDAMESGEYVTGKITEVVKGGLLADVGVRGFIPASLVELGYVEDLKPYVGRELTLKVLECDRNTNKLVLSAKAVLQEESAKKKAETWEKISEGQTVHGIVRRLTSFGAFIDIGGIDGLLHVSEMAWYRVSHPSDVLKENDELDVLILGIDRENEKISLGLKQLLANPWDQVDVNYPVGTIVDAKVVRTAPFGAFVQVEPGVEGLVHISQLAHHRVGKTEDVVSPGDEVQVKVLSVDKEGKRISLSIKEALDLPVEETKPVEEVPEETEMDTHQDASEERFGVTIGDLIGKDLTKDQE
nr:bifunctional 4-hydroxy-3-methylbut-2-enyl diphosphate reductase/30S ribosomal protein S1 [Dehalobacterium formicoaceticum]